MNAPVTLTWNVRFQNGPKGRRRLQPKPSPNATRSPVGRVPRISRLMALAIKMSGLVHSGQVKDYAELARVGMVTRARITQIMNLNLLAPSIQDALLHLPAITQGRDVIKLVDLQPIARCMSWERQFDAWQKLLQTRRLLQQDAKE